MNKLFFLVIFLPTLAKLQTVRKEDESKIRDSGIRWNDDLNWERIKTKAKAENKYIFVDCFATWCGPCKLMDKYIYSLDKVGQFYNDKFICVKIQMDTSRFDNTLAKSWYGEAHSFKIKYGISGFPTLLFFSPTGNIVHKVVRAYNNMDDFIDLGKSAIDPKRQYYKLVDEFENGTLDTSIMKTLAQTAIINGDTTLSRRIATAYVINLSNADRLDRNNINFLNMCGDKALASKLATEFIDKLSRKEIFKKENLSFIWTFTNYSKDRGFNVFYRNADKVDKIFGRKGVARGHTEYIISKEEIEPFLIASIKNDIEPNWIKIDQAILAKYNKKYSKTLIVAAKIKWYGYKRQWAEYTRNLALHLDMNEVKNLNGFSINNNSWDIFERSNNKDELNKAIYWMEKLFKKNQEEMKDGNSIDTYANLLYKVGRRDEAISWEQKAIELDPQKEDFKIALRKMRIGEPTWPKDE